MSSFHDTTRLVGVAAFSDSFLAQGWFHQSDVASSHPPALTRVLRDPHQGASATGTRRQHAGLTQAVRRLVRKEWINAKFQTEKEHVEAAASLGCASSNGTRPVYRKRLISKTADSSGSSGFVWCLESLHLASSKMQDTRWKVHPYAWGIPIYFWSPLKENRCPLQITGKKEQEIEKQLNLLDDQLW